MLLGVYHCKNIRLEHKSAIMVKDEHSKYSLFAQMSNYCICGLYFESNVALKQGVKIQILFGLFQHFRTDQVL